MYLYTSFGKQVIERTVEDIGNMKENMKPTELYRELNFDFYRMRPYQKEDLGEEMTCLSSAVPWWSTHSKSHSPTNCPYRLSLSGIKLLFLFDTNTFINSPILYLTDSR